MPKREIDDWGRIGGIGGAVCRLFSPPQGVASQERRGQKLMAQGTDLPKEGSLLTRGWSTDPDPEMQSRWQRLGFVFGSEMDDLFVAAIYPPGYRVEHSRTHTLYCAIVDDQNRMVATVFYKAAAYDRQAWVELLDDPAPLPIDYQDRKDDED